MEINNFKKIKLKKYNKLTNNNQHNKDQQQMKIKSLMIVLLVIPIKNLKEI